MSTNNIESSRSSPFPMVAFPGLLSMWRPIAVLACPSAAGRAGWAGWAELSPRSLQTSATQAGREERLYGHEPGHHSKNEVRKEKWIRKQRGPRPKGDAYRLQSGLTLNPFQSYGLVSRADWRFPDGSSGILSPRQREAALMMQDMVHDVHHTLKYMQIKPQAPSSE